MPDLNQSLRQLFFKHSSLWSAFGFSSFPAGESVAGYSSGLCSHRRSAAVNPLSFKLISAVWNSSEVFPLSKSSGKGNLKQDLPLLFLKYKR